jgi:hypothetical protein
MQEYKNLLQSAQKLIDVLSDLPAEPVGKPKDVLATIEALENQLRTIDNNLHDVKIVYGYYFAVDSDEDEAYDICEAFGNDFDQVQDAWLDDNDHAYDSIQDNQ